MIRYLALTLLIFSSIAGADSKTYAVKGMKCEDCVENVKKEVCKLPDVTTCTVEMGKVTLTSGKPLDDAKVSKAVEKAGHYKVSETEKANP